MTSAIRETVSRLSREKEPRIVSTTIWKILQERWNEISSACPSHHDRECEITKEKCVPKNCPKLLKREFRTKQVWESQFEKEQAENAEDDVE